MNVMKSLARSAQVAITFQCLISLRSRKFFHSDYQLILRYFIKIRYSLNHVPRPPQTEIKSDKATNSKNKIWAKYFPNLNKINYRRSLKFNLYMWLILICLYESLHCRYKYVTYEIEPLSLFFPNLSFTVKNAGKITPKLTI